MPTYIYKAVNSDGRIVRNRVEEGNKITLIRKLKANGLAPISITLTSPLGVILNSECVALLVISNAVSAFSSSE